MGNYLPDPFHAKDLDLRSFGSNVIISPMMSILRSFNHGFPNNME